MAGGSLFLMVKPCQSQLIWVISCSPLFHSVLLTARLSFKAPLDSLFFSFCLFLFASNHAAEFDVTSGHKLRRPLPPHADGNVGRAIGLRTFPRPTNNCLHAKLPFLHCVPSFLHCEDSRDPPLAPIPNWARTTTSFLTPKDNSRHVVQRSSRKICPMYASLEDFPVIKKGRSWHMAVAFDLPGQSSAALPLHRVALVTNDLELTSVADHFGLQVEALSTESFRCVTSIGCGFFCFCTCLMTADLRGLILLEEIGDGFLHGCSNLTRVDVRGLGNIARIGCDFLGHCTSLSDIDLNGLANLNSVVDGWLAGCGSITSLGLECMTGVAAIGHRWMAGCAGLTLFETSCLASCTTLGAGFLAGCSGLTNVNLEGLRRLRAIEGDFLHACRALRAVNLAAAELTDLGRDFLSCCCNITMVDLTGTGNVTSLPDNFLHKCSSLISVNLRDVTRRARHIGSNFLSCCPLLETLDLSGDSAVEQVGDCFAAFCDRLTDVDVRGLSQVATVGRSFLRGCRSLTSLDVSTSAQWRTVTTIGDHFLYGCIRLNEFDMSGCVAVTSFGYNFLGSCTELVTVRLNGLSKLTSISGNFLHNCSKLTSIIGLSHLIGLDAVGNSFCGYCVQLTSVDLDGGCHPRRVGDHFLHNCCSLSSISLNLIEKT